MNTLELIKEKMPSMSKGQKKIAHFIIENVEDAAFFTASEIGKVTGVSESTVVRFASSLGFDGFPKLQKSISILVKSKVNSVNRIDINNSEIEKSKIADFVLYGDIDRINETISNLDKNAFDAAVNLISNSSTIYIVGVRTCAPLADFMGFYLKMIVNNVIVVTTNSSSEIFEQMINVCEDDTVIGISFPRYSMRTLKAMEFANNRSANVISLTDNIHSPMNLYSSCNLFAGSAMASAIDSLTAPMSLINALLVALCIKNSSKFVKNLTKLEEVWDDYQVTNNDEINYLDENIMKDLRGLKE